MPSIGDTVRELRKKAGLSIQQLADATGLRTGSVKEIEDDQLNPGEFTRRNLAEALSTRFEDLANLPFGVPIRATSNNNGAEKRKPRNAASADESTTFVEKEKKRRGR